MNLESFLNTAIPIGVVIVFGGLVYWKLQEPINKIFSLLWKGIQVLFESASNSTQKEEIITTISYRN
jgi:hypothetical protein